MVLGCNLRWRLADGCDAGSARECIHWVHFFGKRRSGAISAKTKSTTMHLDPFAAHSAALVLKLAFLRFDPTLCARLSIQNPIYFRGQKRSIPSQTVLHFDSTARTRQSAACMNESELLFITSSSGATIPPFLPS